MCSHRLTELWQPICAHWDGVGFELATFWSLDNPLDHLSYGHPGKKMSSEEVREGRREESRETEFGLTNGQSHRETR